LKIQKNAFRFCKWSVAAMVWVGVIFKYEWLMVIVFILLLSSAILTIKYAPMLWLYSKTFGKIGKQQKTDLDVKAMRFAHSLGAILSGIVVLLIFLNSTVGWALALIFAIIKSVSAFGLCPGEKLYKCMKGGCCVR